MVRGLHAMMVSTRLRKEGDMVTLGLLVRLEAKPGKEADVENFLKGGLALVEQEPATTAWFAIRLGPSTFGIFDVFADESAGKRTCQAALQRHSRRTPNCSHRHPTFRSLMSWRPSSPGFWQLNLGRPSCERPGAAPSSISLERHRLRLAALPSVLAQST